MLESLGTYVQTDHCLVIQADGFVLEPTRWSRQFLEYDYIGAPWPAVLSFSTTRGDRLSLPLEKNTVGNGGFSLRSKRLLEATSRKRFDSLNFPCNVEDVLICHYLYDEMRASGIQFAPPEIAALFSIETDLGLRGHSFDSVFGFHGKHWLVDAWKRTGLNQIRGTRRNQACPCGSGRKYKHCCGARR